MMNGCKKTLKNHDLILIHLFVRWFYFASQNLIRSDASDRQVVGDSMVTVGRGVDLFLFIPPSVRYWVVQPACPDTRSVQPAHQHSQRPLGPDAAGR